MRELITSDKFSDLKLALVQQKKFINYYTQQEICDKFSISRMTLNRVKNAKTYRNYKLARRVK